jgi:hypothetical protein
MSISYSIDVLAQSATANSILSNTMLNLLTEQKCLWLNLSQLTWSIVLCVDLGPEGGTPFLG